ncbi:procollagen-lysine,2-oxoglutarate 5-dioxygenase-like isoform X1 [Macrosteles quadrilineatus]|uniref:procollagen-lysine,2-oxoglutarate 5-dioxygenase-like isoform X1 n=1 Tax=Macrosteles quadrilineatus TaxID=74068 RepID=UPI0023E128CC|nr:procollagen-lysine,2-oxoglutarate 5-dioxygenase-like isoform X1 [Macrosteles quadrilineatus]
MSLLLFASLLSIYLKWTIAGSDIPLDQCLGSPQGDDLLEDAIINWTHEASVCNGTNVTFHHNFLLITVATEETDGFKRFIRSTSLYDVPVKVLGMGEVWEGGDMQHPGGGHKVLLLREALKPLAQDKEKIIMFSDSYDVVLLGPVAAILEQFRAMDARVVFSAEPFCWPDQRMAEQYPVTESRYKYLNSGGFIGYASDIYELLSSLKLNSKDDDQLYYTRLFLDKDLREKHRIKLDYNANIFQNLNGAIDDVDIVEDTLVNKVHNTKPLVLHGNGPSKIHFNTLTNYLPRGWTEAEGCATCKENTIDLTKVSEADYPMVVIALYVGIPTPFLREFFDSVLQLDYPKNKIHFFLFNNVEYHQREVLQFVDNVNALEQYRGVKLLQQPKDGISEAVAKMFAREYCFAKDCDYLLVLDSIARLDNPNTLKGLISLNRTIVAPMLVRPGKAWSNFWGDLSVDGFYARSFDYMDIVNNDRRGVWNVPYISTAYLINSTVLRKAKPQYESSELDPDMSFCYRYRETGVFMYVSNLEDYGHLINPEFFDTRLVHPDMYELLFNKMEWERRYISPEYPENFNPDKALEQPCPDVYWFPVTTPEFTQNLIEIMENFGQWSNGTNTDNRLIGGYENVPTRDIHMNQVGYEQTWMEFLRVYVRPLQEHVFLGYIHDPPRSLMNFVVRYRPDEQPSLRPHHDSSTYTINLALNRPKIDYEGGGCRFIRYNCSVTDTRVGWLLMHPGRLTHFHEGLPVTKGTRYIMISFVDP